MSTPSKVIARTDTQTDRHIDRHTGRHTDTMKTLPLPRTQFRQLYTHLR